jgi:hypothetical protein
MRTICKIPVVGDLVGYTILVPFYIFMRLITPPILWFSGFQRMKCGTTIIWAPRNKHQAILDGLKLLQKCDSEMYLRLTGKQHLFIFYSERWKTANAFGHVSGLHERYIKLGVEGVTTFLVQALLLSEACPSINQFKISPGEFAVMRKVLDWMCDHSFHPGLINSYRKVVEKWERSDRFT